MLRSLSVCAGCAIVAATTHVAIMSSGGYDLPTAPLQIAVALGLCVGAVCAGSAAGDGRWILAIVFGIALLSGEAYAIITTSEATLAARDASAAPIRDAENMRAEAQRRLVTAEAAKAAADNAALTEASKPGCRRECRTLIEGSKADTQRELNTARAALNNFAPPRSSAPLADKIGVAGWALDLIVAGLRSIAANGLGAALIAFGATRQTRSQPAPAAPSAASCAVEVQTLRTMLPAPTARDQAARFAREVLTPADANTPVADLHPAYLEWCEHRGVEPFAKREIGTELAELFQRTGLEIVDIDGRRFVARAKLKTARPVLGPMTRIGVSA